LSTVIASGFETLLRELSLAFLIRRMAVPVEAFFADEIFRRLLLDLAR